ncbi:hypothetical protein DIPPA_70121 [Diplonema papillatum]|nr:hypothetical protein DIPPA_70121 [Diplonema papillatum]
MANDDLLASLTVLQFAELKEKWGDKRLSAAEMLNLVQPFLRVHCSEFSMPAVKVEAARLHEIVDSVGEGTVSWDQLSTYLIERAGIANKNGVDVPSNILRYSRTSGQPKLHFTRGVADPCKRLVYCEPAHKMLVISRANHVKLVNPETDFSVASTYSHDLPVLDACYCIREQDFGMEQHLVITSSSDLKLRAFLAYNQADAVVPLPVMRSGSPLFAVDQSESQMVLRWEPTVCSLFSGSRNGNVTVWKLSRSGNSLNAVHRQAGHTEPVLDMCFDSEQSKLFTASLDATLCQWDLNRLVAGDARVRPLSFEGHQKGIYAVRYVDTHRLILTAGFEFAVRCWMEGQPDAKPFELRDPQANANERRYSIASLEHVAGTPQVITCDTAGTAKIWDVRKMLPVQTFCVLPGSNERSKRRSVTSDTIKAAAYLSKSRQLMFATLTETMAYAYEGRAHAENAIRGSSLRQEASAETIRCRLRANRVDLHTRLGLLHCLRSTRSCDPNAFGVEDKKTAISDDEEHVRRLAGAKSTIDDFTVAHEAPPILLCAYSLACDSFVTATETEVKVWCADTGIVQLHLRRLFANACVAAANIDTNGQRLAIASTEGDILIQRIANGSLIKQFVPYASGDLNNVLEVREHSLLVATASMRGKEWQPPGHGGRDVSSKGKLIFYSNCVGAEVSRLPLKELQLPSAVSRKALLFCSKLNLVIAGCENGEVHCFAVDSCSRGSVNVTRVHQCGPMEGEVCSLTHLHPFPAFASSDANGRLTVWSVRPYPHRDLLIAKWNVRCNRHDSVSGSTVVTATTWQHPHTFVTGDERGVATVWDLSGIVINCRLSAKKEEASYFKKPDVQPAPPAIATWKVHEDSIRSIAIVGCEPFLLTSTDTHCRIWDMASVPPVSVGALCLSTASAHWSLNTCRTSGQHDSFSAKVFRTATDRADTHIDTPLSDQASVFERRVDSASNTAESECNEPSNENEAVAEESGLQLQRSDSAGEPRTHGGGRPALCALPEEGKAKSEPCTGRGRAPAKIVVRIHCRRSRHAASPILHESFKGSLLQPCREAFPLSCPVPTCSELKHSSPANSLAAGAAYPRDEYCSTQTPTLRSLLANSHPSATTAGNARKSRSGQSQLRARRQKQRRKYCNIANTTFFNERQPSRQKPATDLMQQVQPDTQTCSGGSVAHESNMANVHPKVRPVIDVATVPSRSEPSRNTPWEGIPSRVYADCLQQQEDQFGGGTQCIRPSHREVLSRAVSLFSAGVASKRREEMYSPGCCRIFLHDTSGCSRHSATWKSKTFRTSMDADKCLLQGKEALLQRYCSSWSVEASCAARLTGSIPSAMRKPHRRYIL